MARGNPKSDFKLTKWRIEHGILTPDLLAKYRIAQQIQKELAEAARLAKYYTEKATNKMDYTHVLRDALEEAKIAGATQAIPRRIGGRPVAAVAGEPDSLQDLMAA